VVLATLVLVLLLYRVSKASLVMLLVNRHNHHRLLNGKGVSTKTQGYA
jgi:hypothetical protein